MLAHVLKCCCAACWSASAFTCWPAKKSLQHTPHTQIYTSGSRHSCHVDGISPGEQQLAGTPRVCTNRHTLAVTHQTYRLVTCTTVRSARDFKRRAEATMESLCHCWLPWGWCTFAPLPPPLLHSPISSHTTPNPTAHSYLSTRTPALSIADSTSPNGNQYIWYRSHMV